MLGTPLTSPSRLWQLSSYLSLVLFCKATIHLNFICFAKANLMGTFAEAQERHLPVTIALGPATFPLVLAELRGLFPAGYPADLGDPFPAGSLQTKPDSLGKPRGRLRCRELRARQGGGRRLSIACKP